MKRRNFIAAIAGIGAIPLVGKAQMICRPNILLDGGFESRVLPAGGYEYTPTGMPWTFTGGAGIQRNGSAWGAEDAPEGSQSAFIQGGAASTISQQVYLDAGGVSINYWMATREYGGPNPVYVYFDGALIYYAVPPEEEWYPFYTPHDVLAAGMHTLTFKGSNGNGDNTTFLDAVSITR